jgi:hypothetical protein
MEQPEADPDVIQQLMFNRILLFMRSLSYEGVTVAGFDASTATLACSLAGVNFAVNVSLREAEPAQAP